MRVVPQLSFISQAFQGGIETDLDLQLEPTNIIELMINAKMRRLVMRSDLGNQI